MSWTQTRSRIAHAKRTNPDADVTELRQQLRAERLELYITTKVNEAPPLTAEQRLKLAGILAGGGPNGTAA